MTEIQKEIKEILRNVEKNSKWYSENKESIKSKYYRAKRSRNENSSSSSSVGEMSSDIAREEEEEEEIDAEENRRY